MLRCLLSLSLFSLSLGNAEMGVDAAVFRGTEVKSPVLCSTSEIALTHALGSHHC